LEQLDGHRHGLSVLLAAVRIEGGCPADLLLLLTSRESCLKGEEGEEEERSQQFLMGERD
jgi:hypothetical protein